MIVADGVALGAAVSTSKTEVEVIVFVAIMLHKVNRVCYYREKFPISFLVSLTKQFTRQVSLYLVIIWCQTDNRMSV